MTDRPPATAAGGTLGSLEHAGAPIPRGIWAPLAWSRFTGVRATRRSCAGDTGCRSTTISDPRGAVPLRSGRGRRSSTPVAVDVEPRLVRLPRAGPAPGRRAGPASDTRASVGRAGLPRTAQAELLVGRQVVVAPPNTDPVGALRRAPAGDDARPTRPSARQREVRLAYVSTNPVHCAVGRSSGTDAETLKMHL